MALIGLNVYRVGMAADVVVGFEDGDLMFGVKFPRRY